MEWWWEDVKRKKNVNTLQTDPNSFNWEEQLEKKKYWMWRFLEFKCDRNEIPTFEQYSIFKIYDRYYPHGWTTAFVLLFYAKITNMGIFAFAYTKYFIFYVCCCCCLFHLLEINIVWYNEHQTQLLTKQININSLSVNSGKTLNFDLLNQMIW